MSGYDQELERFGIKRRWSVTGSQSRYSFGVTCGQPGCNNERLRQYVTEPPPEQIAKQLRMEGWVIGGKVNTCPVCVTKVREAKRKKESMAATTEQDLRATAAVYAELERAYNKEQGRYRQGHDDISVAKVTKTSPVFVGRVRVAVYGEPKTDPELEKIEQDLSAFQAMLDELKSRVARYKAGK